ncbi:hybrid sensor histidine kinase/response regulator [Pelotalea chapellei]|uniref:histidine kinase n=1 Tax=Pelotalea chapellei TaxID=44671 RepID=A0ABS5U9L1_9BACT|nr:hybrid sensor histidine kinase/response regulator [Pelotalea chapellei]MBT1072377.1 hybrid sensor histidine kinase/response regulator [Pelotalea chapellei]
MAGDEDFSDISLLCVEDEQAAREKLCDALSRHYHGMRIFTGNDGEQGLECFHRNRPEIVVTDVCMPGTDGITMAAGIKAAMPATEIIALTAHGESHHLLGAIEIGINSYILKPVVLERLFEAIDGTLTRIRDKRRIEALNAQLACKARELEHLNAELDSFASMVAHDLRTPLASMTTLAELVQKQHNESPDAGSRKNLSILHTELVRMNNLVEKMLAFSRCSRGGLDKKWTDLSSIAAEIVERLRSQDPQREVVFRIADSVHAFGDPLLLRVVLENLLSNAWKYSTGTSDALIEFDSISTEEDLIYFVRDNGRGFVQREESGLFSEFHRGGQDPTIDGFGIGLATVRKILERHGGRIWAESNPGSGAVFFFTL